VIEQGVTAHGGQHTQRQTEQEADQQCGGAQFKGGREILLDIVHDGTAGADRGTQIAGE